MSKAKWHAALISNVAIFLTRKLWRCLWHCIMQHCIILNANKAVRCGIFPVFRTSIMPTRSRWRRHIQYRLCWHGRPFRPLWFLVKQWRNYSTLCPAVPVLRTFMHYLTTFCCQPEAVGDVISGMFVWPVLLNNTVTFHDPSFNGSREIPPKPVGDSILTVFPL